MGLDFGEQARENFLCEVFLIFSSLLFFPFLHLVEALRLSIELNRPSHTLSLLQKIYEEESQNEVWKRYAEKFALTKITVE